MSKEKKTEDSKKDIRKQLPKLQLNNFFEKEASKKEAVQLGIKGITNPKPESWLEPGPRPQSRKNFDRSITGL